MGQNTSTSTPQEIVCPTRSVNLDRQEILNNKKEDPSVGVDDQIKKICALDFGTTHLSVLFCDNIKDINLDIFTKSSSVFDGDRTSAYFLFQAKKESSGDNDEDWECTHVGFDAISECKKLQCMRKFARKRFCLFSNFKMKIYKIVKEEKNIDQCEIKSIPGQGENKQFKIRFLLSKVLKYITDLSFAKMKKNSPNISMSNIKWIVTVPAIWNTKGAQVMENCFKNEWSNIKIQIECVLEPEMATIQAIVENELDIPSNKNIAVFDIGGGTSDLYIFTYNSKTKEISGAASSYGAAFGGENIDKEMLDLLKEVLTEQDIEDNIMSLRTRWEEEKKKIKYETITDQDDLFFDSLLEFNPSTNKNDQSNITVTERNIFVKRQCVHDIYQKWAKKNANLVLEKMRQTQIEMIILVGGMIESDIFYNMIKEELIQSEQFQNYQIIVTKNPKLSIIRGAILYGLKRKPIIISRKRSYTYGLSCDVHISKLEAERKEKLDIYKDHIITKTENTGWSEKYLNDSISIFIKKGDSVELDWKKDKDFSPGGPNTTSATFNIMESDKEYPMLEKEARVIRTFTIKHPEKFTKLDWKDQNYKIRFKFTTTINLYVKYPFDTEFTEIPDVSFDINQ